MRHRPKSLEASRNEDARRRRRTKTIVDFDWLEPEEQCKRWHAFCRDYIGGCMSEEHRLGDVIGEWEKFEIARHEDDHDEMKRICLSHYNKVFKKKSEGFWGAEEGVMDVLGSIADAHKDGGDDSPFLY